MLFYQPSCHADASYTANFHADLLVPKIINFISISDWKYGIADVAALRALL